MEELEHSEANTINFSGRKTEISYHHLQQEYPQIIRKYGNLSVLSINFSFSQIKQNAVDRVMKDLFMIYEIEDDKVVGTFQHKFYFLEHLHINILDTQFTNLDFISYFFIYKNIKSITIDCDQNQAALFFKTSKEGHKVENIVCKPYFTKKFDIYSINNSTVALQVDLSGVEDQIDTMQLQIEENNFSQFLSILEQCKNLITLKLDIISIQDASKDFKKLLKILQTNMPLLSNLDIELYIEQLIPPIKKESFKSPITVSLNYKYPLAGVDLKSLLRKTHKFADSNDSLSIYPYSVYKDFTLKLDFSSKILDIDEQKELLKFISKCNHKLTTFNLFFNSKQEITNKRWVDIINHLGSYEELKFVKIQGTKISRSVAALSVAKLVKCRKTHIDILGQTFRNNILALNFQQLSDYSLKVICENIFDLKSSRITSLSLTANLIIGQLLPISKYFTSCKYIMNQFKLHIESRIEMHEYFLVLLNDVNNVHSFTSSFSFSQSTDLILNVNATELQTKVGQKYSLSNIFYSNMPKQFCTTLNQLLQPISSYSTLSNKPLKDYIKLYSLFCVFWKLYDVCRYQKSQPSQMLAFYTLIGPELYNNPYQVYTDLFYD